MHRWAAGKTIVIQEIWRGRLWAARPVTVVSDERDQLVVWCPKGTVRKVPVTPASRHAPASRPEWFADLLSRCDWELRSSVWDISTIMILREGEWHSDWVSYLATGAHFGYYINLQEPFRRAEDAIRTMDLMLDIVAGRSRSWQLKDEADFEILVERELIDQATSDRIRKEARESIARLESRKPPFDGRWSSWRPRSTFSTPRLPSGWDDVSAQAPLASNRSALPE